MNRPGAAALVLIVALAGLSGPAGATAAESPADVKRFAIVAGANRGDNQETPLRYAESDAERIRETLASVGDFPPDQVLLLKGVSASALRDALIRVNARLRQDEGDTLLVVYYSGHADAENLHLSGTHLPVPELRALLQGSPAASRVLVLDACRSGALTRIKGGRPAPTFDARVLEAPLPRGTAFITSSTATEDSQESDHLRGSFFTHYFNSGLLGAADKDQDGKVTLAEAFSFASTETNLATARTRSGPQNPTYRFDLGGRQDLTLTRPRLQRRNVGIVRLVQPGRYIVQRIDPSGILYPVADVAASRANTQLTLPPGRYQIALRAQDMYLEAPWDVPASGTVSVLAADMRQLDYARVVRKGMGERPVHSLALTGGGRSGYLGLGPAVEGMLSLRQDRRRLSWEARVGTGVSWNENWRRVLIRHHTATVSLLASKTIDLSWVSLGLGAEAGALLIRQWIIQDGVTDREHSTLDPALGAFFGPVVQLDMPLRARAYFRLELAAPLQLMRQGETAGQEKLGWVPSSGRWPGSGCTCEPRGPGHWPAAGRARRRCGGGCGEPVHGSQYQGKSPLRLRVAGLPGVDEDTVDRKFVLYLGASGGGTGIDAGDRQRFAGERRVDVPASITDQWQWRGDGRAATTFFLYASGQHVVGNQLDEKRWVAPEHWLVHAREPGAPLYFGGRKLTIQLPAGWSLVRRSCTASEPVQAGAGTGNAGDIPARARRARAQRPSGPRPAGAVCLRVRPARGAGRAASGRYPG